MGSAIRGLGASGAVLALLVSPAVASAQDKASFRDQAKQVVTALQARIASGDACSLGVQIAPGPVITRTYRPGPLQAGDKLASVNGTDVSRSTPEEVIGALRQSAPDATVSVRVERAGGLEEVKASCSGSKAIYDEMLPAYKFAAAGKFAECAAAFDRLSAMGSTDGAYRLQCAAFKKPENQAEIVSYRFAYLKMLVDEFTYVPAGQESAIRQVRVSESAISASLGASKFQELVDAIKRWPGGAAAYEASAPDWGKFRSNAQAAVSARLIDPGSAQFEWPFGFTYASWKPLFGRQIEGYLTCGRVNARNRLGGYTGRTYFVVVLDSTGAVKFTDLGSGKDFDIVSMQCTNSLGMFPPPQAGAESVAASPAKEGAPATSLVDQLRQLTELKNTGVLTDAEFQAAKAKLLAN